MTIGSITPATYDNITLPGSIVKRDGRIVDFDPDRISRAIASCFRGLKRDSFTPVDELTLRVVNIMSTRGGLPTVETVQDAVELTLQAAGEFEAAKSYILYRAEHAKQRQTRPVPEDVQAAFDGAAKYFPTALQQFQYFDKYSRFDYSVGRRETWVETVDRAVNFLAELVLTNRPGTDLSLIPFDRIRQAILEMKVMPSMRLLAMAGEAARRDNTALYNCFSGDEKLVTRKGQVAFKDVVGGTVDVLCVDGKWRPAEVRSFGQQALQAVTLKHWNGGKSGSKKYEVKVTPNHRWLLHGEGETTSLGLWDKLVSPTLTIPEDELPREAVQHGYVYGDGTRMAPHKGEEKKYAMVRLCGKDQRLADTLFSEFRKSYPPSYKGDCCVYLGPRGYWKDLPVDPTPEYVAGFIHGLYLADGSKTTAGNIRIDTLKQSLVDWLNEWAPVAGYKVLSQLEYGTEDDPGSTNLQKRSAPLQMVLLGTGEAAILRVEKVGIAEPEEVFCVVEPETHTFTLGNGQVTGNCSYIPIDDPEAWVEGLLISMAGCGVGFSVESMYVEELPRIHRQVKNSTPDLFIIPDTAQGWGDALRTGLQHWFEGFDVQFDYSLLRPAGAVLRTKGGRSSGPAPLREMLDFTRRRILARQGGHLRPIDAHDIMCMVGNAAVAGGVRRTAMISLFDPDDEEMLTSKSGDFERDNSQRWNANNSAVWPDEGLTQQQVMEQVLAMVKSERGEPGIFSRSVANTMKPERRQAAMFGTNPCGEISLLPREFCNLSITVARADDTWPTLRDKVELASIIGTIQSLATYFPDLRRPEWKANCEQERLLGVDITGQMDCPVVQSEETMRYLRTVAVNTNARYADILGINRSASVTCVKPSGNSSQLLDCSSGLHARWAPYYIRNVRVSATSPVYKVLKDAGVPMAPENGSDLNDVRTYVVSFPVKSPDGSTTRVGRSALEQCEYWLRVKKNWTEHNPSVTVTYRPDEVIDLAKWIWDHRDCIAGMAFLPSYDAKYDQLPYIEITQEEYEERAAAFPKVDWAKIYRYELEDQTKASQEIACMAGDCDNEM